MADEMSNGSTTVIAGALGKLEAQLTAVVSEQAAQRDLLTRFDERQRGWATKHELSEVSHTLQASLAMTEAKAERANARIDEVTGSMAVMGRSLDTIKSAVDGIQASLDVQEGTVQGGWWVAQRFGQWLALPAVTMAGGIIVGRLT